jgi:hypothetical protein
MLNDSFAKILLAKKYNLMYAIQHNKQAHERTIQYD